MLWPNTAALFATTMALTNNFSGVGGGESQWLCAPRCAAPQKQAFGKAAVYCYSKAVALTARQRATGLVCLTQ